MRERFAGIRRAFRLGVHARELDEELSFHFERTVEELEARGASREEAEQGARRRFGDERLYRRELERIDARAEAGRRWGERWEVVRESVRYALRRMRRSPGLTVGVALTFALGIGANATMFGIVDRLLLSPPAHVADADRVVRVMVNSYDRYTDTRENREIINYPDYVQLTQTESFGDVAAVARREVTLGRGAEGRMHPAEAVTGNYFSMLGVRPAVGRFFGPEEDRVGAPGVAVISHGMWQREFGGSPDIIGRALDLGSGTYTVVGVAPRGFTGVDLGTIDVWVPLRVHGPQVNPMCWDQRNCNWLRAFARLAPGVAPERAEAEATALYRAGWADYHDRNRVDPEARVLATSLIAARGPNAGNEAKVAVWLAAISLMVLLIACANVANLLLARAVRQQREVAVRLALGSSRGRVLGQVLTESLLLALLGGIAALLLTRWGGALLRHVLLPGIAWEGTGAEARVLGVVALLALLAGLFAGVIPALQASRPELAESLKSGSRTASVGVSRTRGTLTVLQAALSVVLLVGAGLFVRSLHRVNSLDLGLDPDGVLLVNPEAGSELPQGTRAEFYRRATERLGGIPGVVAVSGDVSIPFWSQTAIPLRVPGLDSIPVLPSGSPTLHSVGPDYFRVLDLEIRRGRGLLAHDAGEVARAVVVNETMARVLWPGQEPLGKCLIIGDNPNEPGEPPCAEVVGVVENARRGRLVEEEAMQYYLPMTQSSEPNALLVRVRGEPADRVLPIQRALLEVEPELRYPEVRPLREFLDPQSRSWKLGATMFTVFGLLALLVAGIGLYSVLAFSVAQRTLELGIRSALGAPRERLVRLVLGQGLRLVGVGITLGLGIALLAAPRLEPLLFETPPRDPLTLGAVAGVLFLVSLLASGLPALRATRVDPSVALRAE